MGSSFTIYNATNHDIWVTQGTEWSIVGWAAGGALGVVGAAGIGALIAGGAAGVGAGLAAINAATAVGTAEVVATVTGMKRAKWTIVGIVSAQSTAEKDFKKIATRVRPGKSFKFSGTLSLGRTVNVLNNGVIAKKTCWTGATHESNREYRISDK